MSNAWFRVYADFLDDPKILGLAFEDQRHFIGVLALKCAGTIDHDCPSEIIDRIVAQRLWIDHSAIREVKRRLIEAGLIDSGWQPIAWDRRQFVSDHDPSGSERQRRYREKQRNALRNGPVMRDVVPPDTDTDTDTEERRGGCKGETPNAPPTADPPLEPKAPVAIATARAKLPKAREGFSRFWAAYPLKQSKGQAEKTFAKINPDESTLLAILAAIERAKQHDKRFLEGFTPHPSTWLNAKGWEDALADPQHNPRAAPMVDDHGQARRVI
jgi:hypothetical protein